MTMDEEFVSRFIPRGRKTVFLLLHGTGGDENSLLPLAGALDGRASILSVRGNVRENGMPRFFRRFAEGVFDEEDLKFRTSELADFVVRTSSQAGFKLDSVVIVGYSNGANIGASLLLLRPEVARSAVLFRPMVPLRPGVLPDLAGKSVLISAGLRDSIVPKQSTIELESLLRRAGAEVKTVWTDGDHGITRPEVDGVRDWLSSRVARR